MERNNLQINQIPIIINNFNRLNYLRQLITWFENNGLRNIYILDNNSTYPPLIEYYKKAKCKVIYLQKNLGYLALWESTVFDYFKDNFYIYTDSDILPIEECPKNWLNHFIKILQSYPDRDKVGFGIKIDDLPKTKISKQVINHEQIYWGKKISDSLYDAPIDTTLALYRPNLKGGFWLDSYRTAYPYLIRHQPWYLDLKNLSDEEKFYIRTSKTRSHWTNRLKECL